MSDVRQKFILTIASGADSASADMGQSPYKKAWINNETAEVVSVYGSGDGSSYYKIGLASGVINWTDLDIATANSGTFVEVPPLPRYVKVIAGDSVTNGGSVYIATA